MKEAEAQADVPGGNASGIAVELDEDDAMLHDFLAGEGIMQGTGADEEGEESGEEMQELLDVADGFEILAGTYQQR